MSSRMLSAIFSERTVDVEEEVMACFEAVGANADTAVASVAARVANAANFIVVV